MHVIALIFSVIALIFSYLAYRKSGGTTEELKAKVEDLGLTTEKLRAKTADALNRLEKSLRGENRAATPETKDDSSVQETNDSKTENEGSELKT